MKTPAIKEPNSPLDLQPLRTATALVLLAVVIALGGLSFQRKVAQFQRLGFAGELRAGHLAVTAVTHPSTRLVEGDQIMMVNGTESTNLERVRESLLGRETSKLLVLRANGLQEILYTRAPIALDWPYLILAFVAVGYLLIGFFTLWKDRQAVSFRFYLWCLASAVVYLFSPAGPFDAFGQSIFLLEECARLFLGPLTLHLLWRFPQPLVGAINSRLSKTISSLFYLPASFMALLQVDLALFNGRFFFSGNIDSALLGLLDRIELGHLMTFVVASIVILALRVLRSRQLPSSLPVGATSSDLNRQAETLWESRRQVTWMTVGLTAGYMPFLLLYALPRLFDLAWPEPVTIVAVLPLALVPLTFAYAILRYRLWDIAAMVRDTASLSLTVLIGIIGFTLVNLLANRAIPEDLTMTRNLASFATGLMLAGVMLPTKRGISASLERLQYRSHYRKRKAMRDFGSELVHERDLGQLCANLLESIRDGLGLERLNLLLVDQQSLWLAFPQPGLEDEIDLVDTPSAFWERSVAPISASTFTALGAEAEDAVRKASLETDLFQTGYRYVFPLRVRDRQLGLLLVGHKADGEPLSSDDSDLIRNLLNQAALAFENARLLDEVNQRLHQVSRLQQHNQQIIASSPAGIAVLDQDGEILSANRAFAEVVRTREDELVGRPVAEVLPVTPLPEPGQGLLELSFCEAGGSERHLQITASELQEEGESRRILVVQDVSERVAMENELEEKERLAALGMLAAGVAHEVNTPITGISSYAQMLLADTPESDPRHELLRKVERQTFRAAGIVNNLLEFSRDRRPDYRAVNVTNIVDEALDHLHGRLTDKGITVLWKHDEASREAQKRAVVYGADGEILQVVTNLLTNAIDAVPANTGQLELKAKVHQGRVLLTFSDNGEGIAQEQAEKIFQPFFSTKLAKGGTGLGLSISYNIIRRHGGEIRVESEPGAGATFIIEMPAYEAQPQEEMPQA